MREFYQMPAYIGFYLHGFLSSGASEKGQWFNQKVREDIKQNNDACFSDWITPTYPINQVAKTTLTIEKELMALLGREDVKQGVQKVILIGSSMGGFYVQYFAHEYNLPFVMINPALNPEAVFRKNLGKHQNPTTGEEVCINEDYIEELLKYAIDTPDSQRPALLLIDQDDEVIDVDFALQYYTPKNFANMASKRVVYNGGDHRFIHLEEAWKEICQFVARIEDL